jgi:hypothetical protein
MSKRIKKRWFAVLLLILVGSISLFVANHGFLTKPVSQTRPTAQHVQITPTSTEQSRPTALGTPFFASTDTMKESRDTETPETRRLSSQEIHDIVTVSASINTNYITVDTHWDYPDYTQQWINAIRATGHHVWFRSHPNQWENSNGATGTMTPALYETAESAFILAHASLFQAGDIFDACSEPEQGNYWFRQYGDRWTSAAPNAATQEYNAFIRDTTDVANAAFQQKGIHGVITSVRSTNTFFPTHPNVFEQATVDKFGSITIDSYPEGGTQDPSTAAGRRLDELETIENLWHVPIVIGEMGYSNEVEVDDLTQQNVLRAEFQVMEPLSYIAGVNYWVGAGTETSGGYTHIFAKSGDRWILRPAAHELSAFYKAKLS